MAERNIYLGVTEATDRWLREVSASSGLPLGRVVDVVVAEAERRGWTVEAAAVSERTGT